MLYQPVSQWHSLHFELLIELVAQKLTELWRFKNLAYFLTWWPSSMTYFFVNVTYWNCSPIPYVDQVWWWYVKAFMSYAWQNWQTNRQTDRQTDERAIGDCVLAKICYYVHDAHCIGDSDNWNIVDYIDVLLVCKSIGLHALAWDANALYPSIHIRPVLWPGDLVIEPLILKIDRVMYSAKMHLCMKFCEAMSKHS